MGGGARGEWSACVVKAISMLNVKAGVTRLCLANSFGSNLHTGGGWGVASDSRTVLACVLSGGAGGGVGSWGVGWLGVRGGGSGGGVNGGGSLVIG